MNKKYKYRIFAAAIFTVFVGLVYINKGWGPSEMVEGTITHFGMNYAVKNTRPHPIVTVELENGKKIFLNLPSDTRVKVGDKLEILQMERLITSGKEYQFVNVHR